MFETGQLVRYVSELGKLLKAGHISRDQYLNAMAAVPEEVEEPSYQERYQEEYYKRKLADIDVVPEVEVGERDQDMMDYAKALFKVGDYEGYQRVLTELVKRDVIDPMDMDKYISAIPEETVDEELDYFEIEDYVNQILMDEGIIPSPDSEDLLTLGDLRRGKSED